MARRLERKGTRSGAVVYDDYAHHPTEVAASLAALRELPHRRLIAVFQPHLYSRTKALAARFGRALSGGRRDRRPRRLPGAGAADRPARRASAASTSPRRPPTPPRAGGSAGWATSTGPSSVLAGRLGEGDLLVTLGAGDVFELGDRLVGEGDAVSEPAGLERDFDLSRLTTVRVGGPADMFARAGSEDQLTALLAYAEADGSQGRSGRLGIEPTGIGRWISRTRAQARS